MSPAHKLSDLYAEPRTVINLNDCWFYHTIDLPGYGTIEGPWDLRAGIEHYFGGVQFRRQRVLELGTASGFLCFWMERQGADVVAVELPPGVSNDLIPRSKPGVMDWYLASTNRALEKMRNSFWFSHRLLQSRARVVHASAYAIPAEIDRVDIATFGCILLHLRDPFLALANVLRLTRKTAVVTTMYHGRDWEAMERGGPWQQVGRFFQRLFGVKCPAEVPYTVFMGEETPGNMDTWWFLTPVILKQFLAILGFENATVTTHTQILKGEPTRMYTVLAHRTQPMPKRITGPYPWF